MVAFVDIDAVSLTYQGASEGVLALQAEVIEKLMPLMANAVDRLADTVEPMQRVTW